MAIDKTELKMFKPAFVVLGSVFIFNSLPRFSFIGEFFTKYPVIIFLIGVAIIILATKD